MKAEYLFTVFFLSCSLFPTDPILNFTVSGKLTLDDIVLSQTDTLKLDSTDEIRVAAFLRRYNSSASTFEDKLVSNEIRIKYSKDNQIDLNITTEGIRLQEFDCIYLLGYFHQQSNPFADENYVRSSSDCPVFKGKSAAFIYYEGGNSGLSNFHEKGWNIYDDNGGSLKTSHLKNALLTVHFLGGI